MILESLEDGMVSVVGSEVNRSRFDIDPTVLGSSLVELDGPLSPGELLDEPVAFSRRSDSSSSTTESDIVTAPDVSGRGLLILLSNFS